MNTQDMPVVVLNGSPFERGKTYGIQQQKAIAHIVSQWRADLGNFGCNSKTATAVDADQYLQDFFARTNYLSAIRQWTPLLLEEIEGIAAGAGQPVENILGVNLMDEEWIFGLRRGLDRPSNKCTAFGLVDGDNDCSYAGQNMDIGSWVDGQQLLLHLHPGPNIPEALVFSIAGCIGLNGLNASGLGVTCNTLAQLTSSTDGLPVLFIVRSLLEKNSIDEAEEWLHRIPHASGQNYLLSSKQEMRCFECSHAGVVRYTPNPGEGRVFHTNHPLVSQDIDPCLLTSTGHRMANTEARLRSICSRLGKPKAVSLQAIIDAVSAHDDPDNPVSRNINHEGSSIGFTAGSSIYEFGNQTRLHLAAGPPCETVFKIFDFLPDNGDRT